jgi:deazaflavin-dependent oxidoreductase (nitroreductase family)
MVVSRRVAAFNRRVTNRVTGPFAGWLPGFGVVTHVGRRSGRPYRTPVNLFAAPGGYLIALPYGRDSDWVRNVLAAGGCDVRTRGRVRHLTEPEVVHDPARASVPPPVRAILGLIGVDDFLKLSAPQGDEPGGPPPPGADRLPGPSGRGPGQ